MRPLQLLCLILCISCSPPAWAEEPEVQLWAAARKGELASVKQLLAAGVDVDVRTRYGATALSFACDHGHFDVVRTLVDWGADVNVKDTFYKSTPLGWAASGGHGEIVKLLLGHGATDADAAIRTAAGNGSLSVVRAVLESAKAKPQTVAACRDLALDRGHGEIVKLIDASLGEPAALPVVVPLGALQTYIGSYQSDTGWEYKVEVRDGNLMIGSPYQAPVRLQAIDERTFRFFDTTYTFDLEDDRVVGFTRVASSKPLVFKREGDKEPASTDAGSSSRTNRDQSRIDDLAVSSDHWPSFRGTGARGIADGQHAPSSWDVGAGVNVRWKTPVPGLAHSCPIIWGDRIFLTTAIGDKDKSTVRTGLYGDVTSFADDSPHAWHVLCFDKKTGQVVWDQTARAGVPRVRRHPKSTHANPTPATDGKHVVAFFGSEGLYCYELDGRLLWQKTLGDLNSGWFYDEDYQWGFGSSPIIYAGMVIVQCDAHESAFIAAYDVRTGAEIWKSQRDEIPTWASPTVYEGPDGPVLITNGSRFARGYDPRNGEELWRLSGHSEIAVPTPLVAHDLIFVCSGYRPIKPIYAIHLTARGDISLENDQSSNQHIAWSHQQGGPYLPTPIVYRDYFYVCSNAGIVSCYHAKTGRREYQRRVRSGAAKSFTASPLAADGKLYFTSEEGVVLVVQAGPKFKLLHTNPAGESCLATPAISEGLFILRTQNHLIAVGE